jgi:cytidylate kinase
MWYFKYLKNLLCIRVVAELFVLRLLLETQVYGLIFLDIMFLIAEQIRAIKAANRDYSIEREREIQELLKDEKLSEERYEELYGILEILY